MYNTKPKCRKIKKNLPIVVNKDIVIEGIRVPKGAKGVIVYAKNQVSADVWLLEHYDYKSQLSSVEQDSFLPNRFKGIVLTLDRSDFAIEYSYEEHSEIMIEEEGLLNIPYLSLSHVQYFAGLRFIKNERVREYRLVDIIEEIEKCFSEFTSSLNFETVEEDNPELDYMLTEESSARFHTEREKITEAFMKATGIHYSFLGGLIEA